MGLCCTRSESTNEEILSSIFKNESPELNHPNRKPELFFECLIYDKNTYNDNLNSLISNINQLFLLNTKKITLLELYNISLFYQDDHTTSNYLIYDFRNFNLQCENFLKKMRHINYSYDEIKIMSNSKLENFKRFIRNKIIIFILPEGNTDLSFSAITKLSEFKTDFSIQFLNSTLLKNHLSPNTNKLLNFLDEREYCLLPYIFFCFSHLNFVNKEGYGFLNLITDIRDNKIEISYKKLFNLNINEKDDKQININTNNNINSSQIISRFFVSFMVTSIIHIKDSQEIKEESYTVPNIPKANVHCKEFVVPYNVKDLRIKKGVIKEVCKWIKSEMVKGHSFEIEVEDEKIIKSIDWIYSIIIIMCEITLVYPKMIINYLMTKGVYVNGMKEKIENNIQKINALLSYYGFKSAILQ